MEKERNDNDHTQMDAVCYFHCVEGGKWFLLLTERIIEECLCLRVCEHVKASRDPCAVILQPMCNKTISLSAPCYKSRLHFTFNSAVTSCENV